MPNYNLFEIIDLDYPGLHKVKEAYSKNDIKGALELFFSYFIHRKNVDLYVKEDITNIAEYCRTSFPIEVEDTINTAEEVLNHNFVFRYTWDMERTNVPYKFNDEVIWDYCPNGDEEWVFMLNRHRYFTALGQSYALTGNEKYAKGFFNLIDHWIDNNPLGVERYKTTWRTIEAGCRCENWIKSLMYFINSKEINGKILEKIIISLYEHGKYIYNSYNHFRRLSNWGVIENHGLFMISVFLPELKDSALYRKESINRLEEEIKLQVMKDGMHWEQSPMYHNEVLHCYLDTIILAERNKLSLPSIILEKTKAMSYADFYMAKPNHHQPMQSDSDDTDLRDIITKAAVIFRDGTLKYGAYPYIDFESIWDLGCKSLKEFEDISIEEPKHKSYGFNYSGNYYMRSGWGEKDNYLYFHCGNLGSGHGHADLLHFDLFSKGESILIDPGRYTYVEGNALRDYLKSCKAHNTITVDDEDFTLCEGSWKYAKAATSIKQEFISEEAFDFVQASHLGYMDLKDPVFITRKVIFVKPYYYVLVDEFYSKGKHNYKQYFHFDKGEVTLEENKVVFRGNKAKLTMLQLNSQVTNTLKDDYISKEYNKFENSKTLVTSLEGEGFTSIITVLYPEEINDKDVITAENLKILRGDNKEVEEEEAEAIKICFKDKEHIITISHNEAFKGSKLYVVEDIPVYGKVVIVNENKEGIVVI